MKKSSLIIGEFLFAFICGTTAVLADQCSDLVQQEKQITASVLREQQDINRRMRELGVFESRDELECESAKVELNYLTNEASRRRQTESVCGNRLKQVCDSSCMQERLVEQRTTVQESCSHKTPSLSPTEAAKNPTPSRSASSGSSPQTPYRPANSVSCGSDITGAGGPPANTQTCLNNAQWNNQQPYNHSIKPIQFHQFNGPDIIAQLEESIWSIPDDASPTGRRLEARPYDKETTTGGNCAQENTNATLKPFIVSIQCEIERQAKLEKDFEHREDVCACNQRSNTSLSNQLTRIPA